MSRLEYGRTLPRDTRALGSGMFEARHGQIYDEIMRSSDPIDPNIAGASDIAGLLGLDPGDPETSAPRGMVRSDGGRTDGDKQQTFEIVVGRVERFLIEQPDATGHDVLREIRTVHEATMRTTQPTDECRHCGPGIWADHSGQWRHADLDNSVGCRAASFTADHGWNDDLDRRWSARPA